MAIKQGLGQFAVQPADYGAALGGLGQNLNQLGEQMRQQRNIDTQISREDNQIASAAAAKAAQEAARAAAEQEAMELLQGNPTVEEVEAFSIRNPDLAKVITSSMQRKNQVTTDSQVDTLKNIVAGGNPEVLLAQHIKTIESQGGDASDSADELQTWLAVKDDPEASSAWLNEKRNLYAITDPAGSKELRELAPKSPELKVGRYQFKETPDGYLKTDTATGETSEIKVGSKEFERLEKERQAKFEAEIDAEGDKFDKSKKIRDEYTKRSGEFIKVRDAYDRIQASVESPDAAGDIALIFNYMKMLDPGSVVREGEFATAQNAGGVDSTVYNMYNKLLSGERLQPKQRDMFSSRAGKLFSKAETRNKKDKSEILGIGKRYGLNEEDIFGIQDEEVAEPPSQPETPAPDAALQYLQTNPQFIDAFEQKYGYRPEGF